MAEATTTGNFGRLAQAFKKAIDENDRDTIFDIGPRLIETGFRICCNPNQPSDVKESYSHQCINVARHMANCAHMPASSGAPVAAAGDGGDGREDPFYKPIQWFSDEVPDLNFSDIIGVQEVKNAFIVDIVAPLRSEFRDSYRKFRGDQLGTQLLLYGPPGTGKTHIVKCLAGVLGCKIAVVQTSEVLASVVGVAEKNIRDIFAQAAELDRCIIFFDEIDSICSDRDSEDSRHTKSILTTLLTCMDGFLKTKKEGGMRVIVAATNLPWKLDPALKRGGRFETQIYVPLPDEVAVEKFVSMGLEHMPHDANVTVQWLAKRLKGYSGADIKAILKQIANRPLRREVLSRMAGKLVEQTITLQDCEEVLGSYINSVTAETLACFEAYNRGMPVELIKKMLKNPPQG